MKRIIEVRGVRFGDGRPKICVPVVAEDEEELLQVLNRLQEAEYDLIEWRADHFPGIKDAGQTGRVLEMIRDRIGDVPLLFTVRTRSEGGEFDGSLEEYAACCLAAAKSRRADLVDVELLTAGEKAAVLTKQLQDAGVKVIGSSHDFQKTPGVSEMTDRLCRMQRAGMDLTKLAVMPQNRLDVLRLLEAAVRMEEELADRPCITMAMGRTGLPSRFLGEFTGSAVTFASAGTASAPGQIGSGEMKRLLDEIHEASTSA